MRARLSDARHFWDTDQRDLPDYATPENAGKPLDQRLAKLSKLGIVFHEKLGTQGERVERIVALARELAPLVGADPDLAARAAELAKADLVTEMVGEFPEVQGLMGRRYAELQGEHPTVAAAIEEHYKPQGPSDRVPTDPVSRRRGAGRQARHAGRASGRSTRSRPAARTRMRCGGRRWG